MLKHLSEIDSECRPDNHSAHPILLTHTDTHTHKGAHTCKYTLKWGRALLRVCSGHRAWVWSERERERERGTDTEKDLEEEDEDNFAVESQCTNVKTIMGVRCWIYLIMYWIIVWA